MVVCREQGRYPLSSQLTISKAQAHLRFVIRAYTGRRGNADLFLKCSYRVCFISSILLVSVELKDLDRKCTPRMRKKATGFEPMGTAGTVI